MTRRIRELYGPINHGRGKVPPQGAAVSVGLVRVTLPWSVSKLKQSPDRMVKRLSFQLWPHTLKFLYREPTKL